MDEEVRRLEHAVAKLGNRFGALVRPHDVEPGEHWERVTLVGLSGHHDCLVGQHREHLFLVRVHSIEALAALPNVMSILDLRTREQVQPYGFWAAYMHDLERGLR